MKRPLGTVCAVCLAVTALLATWHAVGAEQVDFRFKWPWRPLETTAVAVTTLPYSGVHDCQSGSCTDAYDFVISDDRVISSAEGTVIQRVDSIDPQTCIAEQGLGNCAKVLVPTPTEVNPASTIQVWYGHLQSVSAPPVNGTILQGDPVGIQGITGYTIGNDYGWNGTSWGYHCGRHLHFEFYPSSPSNPQRPDKIDGQNTKPTISPPLVSTNSGIGQYWYYGTTNWPIRNKYIAKGGWDGLNPSDPADDMGWTSDPQRSGLPSPQALYVHTYRVWGFEQNFRHDPDPWGRQVEGLYEADWSPGTAYLVDSPFWEAWEFGAWVGSAYWSISIPRGDIGSCPGGSAPICLLYQRFHLGYIWMDRVYTGVQAVWCPDVFGDDYAVNIIGDVLAVLEYAGTYQGGPPNANGKYYDPWYDMDGDGAINITTDVLLVVAAAGDYCYPT
ncbi:MAG: hypothetical protein WBF66_02105 [Dehalococcoidia bacterium]